MFNLSGHRKRPCWARNEAVKLYYGPHEARNGEVPTYQPENNGEVQKYQPEINEEVPTYQPENNGEVPT
jgi:hypothetical protein